MTRKVPEFSLCRLVLPLLAAALVVIGAPVRAATPQDLDAFAHAR